MDNFNINLESLLTFISRQLHTFIRQYDIACNLEYTVCELSDCKDPLTNDLQYSYRMLSCSTTSSPEIIDMNHEIFYASVKSESKFFLLGPVRLTGSVFFRTFFEDCSIPDSKQTDIPETNLRNFIQYTLLLHNLFAQVPLSLDDFLISILSDEEYNKNIQKNFGNILFENQENHTQHNSYGQEIREMDSIRSGDIERLKQSWQEDYIGSFGVLGPTRLRTYQNLGIVITVLASRAAIEGGVHPEIAFSLADSYCQKIEETHDATVAGQLGRQAEMQFTKMVRKIRDEKHVKSPTYSTKLNQCKDYIFSHLHDKITVADIAHELNVHPNYLSSLFKQHEGVSITQYILQEKIKLAQNMLIYSSYSYSSIASYLGFSSQSYLGVAFKKLTGYTLKNYRNQFGYSNDIQPRS